MSIRVSQTGVGLIEVSLLLLMVALLGYSALQGQAIKSTNESLERAQSLVIMRNIAEKIHANPSAITTYATKLNASGNAVSSKQCGLDGLVAALCTPTELAEAESFRLKTELQGYDFQVQMHPCPNSGGTGANVATNIMYSYCLISAWGNTTPTIGTDSDIGTDGKMDCLTAQVAAAEDVAAQAGGNYHSKSTCMMMEI